MIALHLKNRLRSLFVGVSAAALMLISGQSASAGGGFEISWYTIDGGGGVSTGGGFELSGTIGQPDAGVSAGSGYSLTGGFWSGGAESGPACPADLTGDGQINLSDLLVVLSNWGACP